MGLINNMTGLTEGEVCINEHLSYFTYDYVTTGCTCYDVIDHIEEDISTGEKVSVFININENIIIDTGNTETCLVLSGFSDWIVSYINSIATSGYTGTTGGTENRIIFDISTGKYYKIDHFIDTCYKDTIGRWAIINNETKEIWLSGDTQTYYYDELNGCEKQTGNRNILLSDINKNSGTYGNYEVIIKCQNETSPVISMLSVNNPTSTTATFSGVTHNTGGFNITECGFCYSRFRNPSINDTIVYLSNEIGDKQSIITGLTSNSYYYTNMFASNAIGISYGTPIIFKTNS